MKYRSIGIDIDGCLNNLHEAIDTILRRDYGIVCPPTEYNLTAHAEIKNQALMDFWKKYDPELHCLMSVEENAVEVLLKLKSLGYNIEIATARHYASAEITVDWLKKNLLHYDEIFFCGGDKVDVCRWRKLKVMIEDNPDNALALANNGITVILYSRPYN